MPKRKTSQIEKRQMQGYSKISQTGALIEQETRNF